MHFCCTHVHPKAFYARACVARASECQLVQHRAKMRQQGLDMDPKRPPKQVKLGRYGPQEAPKIGQSTKIRQERLDMDPKGPPKQVKVGQYKALCV